MLKSSRLQITAYVSVRISGGSSIDDAGKLASVQDDEKTTKLLLKLVQDMQTNELTLNELLKAANRDAYIDVLDSKGYLPTKSPLNQPRNRGRTTAAKPSNKGVRHSSPTKRNTLIPRGTNYDFQWSHGQTKIHMAWEQLQYHLDIEKHKFAVAVLLRTLIELAAKNYQDKRQIKGKGSLVKDLMTINDQFLDQGKTDGQSLGDARRIINGSKSSNSLESLHRVLHSQSHIPSTDDLTTMWDCLEPLLIRAIKEAQI